MSGISNKSKYGWIHIDDSRKPKQLQECLCICRLEEEETNKYDYYLVLKWHDFPYQDNGIVNRPHFTDEGVAGMRVVYWKPLDEHPEKRKCVYRED